MLRQVRRLVPPVHMQVVLRSPLLGTIWTLMETSKAHFPVLICANGVCEASSLINCQCAMARMRRGPLCRSCSHRVTRLSCSLPSHLAGRSLRLLHLLHQHQHLYLYLYQHLLLLLVIL